jgi:putative glutamine amidotransferase
LRSAGALPFLVPPVNEHVALDALLAWLDGLLLVGDAAPSRPTQPETVHGALDIPVQGRRRRLLRRAAARRTPTLAVGAGFEELAVGCGGTLYCQFRDERQQALPHQGTGDLAYAHAVLLDPDSRIAAVYGRGEIRVPSAHALAVRQPGSRLRATAWAADGLIEAVEAADPKWFCLGVQWQPRWDAADGADRRLLVRFVEACRRPQPRLASAA